MNVTCLYITAGKMFFLQDAHLLTLIVTFSTFWGHLSDRGVTHSAAAALDSLRGAAGAVRSGRHVGVG